MERRSLSTAEMLGALTMMKVQMAMTSGAALARHCGVVERMEFCAAEDEEGSDE